MKKNTKNKWKKTGFDAISAEKHHNMAAVVHVATINRIHLNCKGMEICECMFNTEQIIIFRFATDFFGHYHTVQYQISSCVLIA